MSKSLLPFSHLSSLFPSSNRIPFHSLGPTECFFSLLKRKQFSSPSTPYPLQYDMIISRPAQREHTNRIPSNTTTTKSKPTESSDSDSPESQLNFEDWVDKKLMDSSQRKYYKKREKRMYGGDDSDDERRKRREKSELVELKPEVVEFRTLHRREEELYFYDAFAFPWEKDKHYKMVYQLEKKYFPEQSLDKAFLQPGEEDSRSRKAGKKREEKGEEGLVFFEEGRDDNAAADGGGGGGGGGGGKDLSEKKVEEFFKCLKRVPDKNGEVSGGGEPYLASRTAGLPHKWDSPEGTVVLVNKPKGVSFHLLFSRFGWREFCDSVAS